ncbi:zinc transport [Fusarium beomiforme]|uniref:Zinc transport n=1 Tax=Fusarium beomiforme TaxID=44412 RepID=A0A9P5AL85_9HYPO|nr:zinc transport [Fusarium beomiforme]
MTSPSYQDFVAFRARANPCISQVSDFLKHKCIVKSKIVYLDYIKGEKCICRRIDVPETSLSELMSPSTPVSTRFVFVENISPSIMALLGEKLDIDPLFFANYVHVAFENLKESYPPPLFALLPSFTGTKDHIHLHCHKVVALEGSENDLKDVPYSLKTEGNVPRNVRRLITLPGGRFALAQTVCSFIVKLVGDMRIFTYRSRSSQGGFEDFQDPKSFSYFRDYPPSIRWDRASMMENIIHYLQANPPPQFDSSSPSILSIGYYPICITLSQWNIYNYQMRRCSKFFEYSDQVNSSRGHHEVLVYLQRLRRRTKSSHQKLGNLAGVISSHIQPSDDSVLWNGIISDIDILRDQLHAYSQSLEQMIMVSASLVQLLDSRRSILEAINTKRLTFLAFVFVPLAWVASLFSMSDKYSPGHDRFWVYFATALPVLAVVLLLSALPYNKITIAAESYKARVRNQRKGALGDV